MTRNRRLLILPLTALLLALAAGCSSDGCFDNGSALPLAGFYTVGSGGTATQTQVAGLSAWGVGVPGDSLIVSGQTSSQVYLPLRPTASSTQFVLQYAPADSIAPDTLTINYKAQPTFVSRDCGAMYFYEVSGYSCTHNRIDSVAFPYGVIDNIDRVNIRIYLAR